MMRGRKDNARISVRQVLVFSMLSGHSSSPGLDAARSCLVMRAGALPTKGVSRARSRPDCGDVSNGLPVSLLKCLGVADNPPPGVRLHLPQGFVEVDLATVPLLRPVLLLAGVPPAIHLPQAINLLLDGPRAW